MDTVLNLQEPTKAGECKLYNKNPVLSDAELWKTANEKERERVIIWNLRLIKSHSVVKMKE